MKTPADAVAAEIKATAAAVRITFTDYSPISGCELSVLRLAGSRPVLRADKTRKPAQLLVNRRIVAALSAAATAQTAARINAGTSSRSSTHGASVSATSLSLQRGLSDQERLPDVRLHLD
jgi:hypothetical protein